MLVLYFIDVATGLPETPEFVSTSPFTNNGLPAGIPLGVVIKFPTTWLIITVDLFDVVVLTIPDAPVNV